jgi:hypothetical protein
VWLFGGSLAAGFAISNALAFGGLAVVRVIVQRLRGDESARRTVMLMCFYPLSFVLSSYRSEGLFLFLLAVCYLALLERR